MEPLRMTNEPGDGIMNVSAALNSAITGPCFCQSGGPIFFSVSLRQSSFKEIFFSVKK